jgi:hypothetical protein
MTKKHKKENDFLDEIRHVPNISSACQKVGISRNTIYRWCSEDPSFKYRLDQAMSIGIDSVSDLAESKLIGLINISDFRAIAYWLDNNKKVYIKPRPKVYQDPDPFVPITYIEVTPVDPLNLPPPEPLNDLDLPFDHIG